MRNGLHGLVSFGPIHASLSVQCEFFSSLAQSLCHFAYPLCVGCCFCCFIVFFFNGAKCQNISDACKWRPGCLKLHGEASGWRAVFLDFI